MTMLELCRLLGRSGRRAGHIGFAGSREHVVGPHSLTCAGGHLFFFRSVAWRAAYPWRKLASPPLIIHSEPSSALHLKPSRACKA